MRNLFVFVVLVLAGCGLKTDLVVYDDSAPMPEIASLEYQVSEQTLSLNIDIKGGSGAVAYQTDRAVIEPDCKCIGNWLRYYESSASQQREALIRNITIRPDLSYAFRLRAEDSLDRRSGWSRVIKVMAQGTAGAKEGENDMIKVEGAHE